MPSRCWIIPLLLLTAGPASAQSFDYKLQSVQILRIDPSTGDSLFSDALDEYLLYDLGPQPSMQFVATVEMLEGLSQKAKYVNLKIERHILLNRNRVIDGVLSEPAWSYNASILLPYEREMNGQNVVKFTTAQTQLEFLDPSFPAVQSPPLNSTLHGYSYQFFLVPANPSLSDSNPNDNSSQISFLFK